MNESPLNPSRCVCVCVFGDVQKLLDRPEAINQWKFFGAWPKFNKASGRLWWAWPPNVKSIWPAFSVWMSFIYQCSMMVTKYILRYIPLQLWFQRDSIYLTRATSNAAKTLDSLDQYQAPQENILKVCDVFICQDHKLMNRLNQNIVSKSMDKLLSLTASISN